MDQTRTQRLKILFDNVLDGKKTRASNNPKLFLEAICVQTQAVMNISRLVASPLGLEILLLALSSDTSLSFLNGQLTTFLEYLKASELHTINGGCALRQVLAKLMEAPLTWKSLVKAAQDQVLDERALSAFSWLLIQMLSLPVEEASAHLTVAQDPDIRRTLMSSSDDVKTQGQQIVLIVNKLVRNLTYEQRKDTQRGPGGRHNNDFAEIEKIAIYPTKEELQLGTWDVYLPRASDVEQQAEDPNGLASHIDAQFRLLRENMLCDLREELAAAAQPKKRRRKPLEVKNLTLCGIHCNERHPWSLQLACKNDLPQFQHLSPKNRKKFLRDHPKFLKHGCFVCLYVGDEFVTLGTLFREEDLLLKAPSVLCIQIPSSDVKNVLMELSSAGSGIRLLHVDTAIFTYEPVLKQLKKMRELSLSPEIVSWQAGTSIPPPDYYLSSTLERLLEDLSEDYSCDLQSHLFLEKPTRLDWAQAECFRTALQQRVVVIQGPPGTGKSFIGSLVGKAIYESSDEKILIVCYTHHALDDFVEDLISLGIPDQDIVRLGSTHKATARTKSLGLKECVQGRRLMPEQQHIVDTRKWEVMGHATNLENDFLQFVNFSPRYHDVLEFLERCDDNLPFHEAFKLPEDEDGMTRVGRGGKKMDKYYLVDRWFFGMDAGIFKTQIAHDCRPVWRLTRKERDQKWQQWFEEITEERLAQLCRAGELYNDAVEEIDAVFLEKDLAVMRSKRIIACTTTAAAKYSDIIQCVSPGVLLVEEAGEILESHVLSALSPKTKHLILIGDHKQLRPKVNYELSIEKGTGYDLNRSLFERLILKGFPHQTLFSQHRMRPEISALVREMTYPELNDAKETQGRPDLRGFTDNIIFVNHREPESEFSGALKLWDSKAGTSKQNQFEAKMTLKCVRYLSQQGYGTSDIVVLTPYLGQLRLLHDELKVDNDPVLNDLDCHDLVRAGLMPEVTGQVNKPRLRISTVDNFQGEEANIIVASLCRSNIDKDIGFMSAPERLNVLISRARDAIIVIGNAEHFMGSRKGGDLWSRFMDLLKAGMHVYDGLPVCCERHPHHRAILQKPADFDTYCPDGGCDEPCDKVLNCGIHKCPDRCHMLYNHSKIKCNAVVSLKCAKGHVNSRVCHAEGPVACYECVIEAKEACEAKGREAEQKGKAQEAKQQHLLKMAELDRAIEAVKAEALGKDPFKDHAEIKLNPVVPLKCAKGHVNGGKYYATSPDVCAECVIEGKKTREAEQKLKAQEAKQQHLLKMAELNRKIEATKTATLGEDHSKIKSNAVVSLKCAKGHVNGGKYYAASPDVCAECVIEAKKAHETEQHEAEQKVKAQEAEQQHSLKMAKLDREIKATKSKASGNGGGLWSRFIGLLKSGIGVNDGIPVPSANLRKPVDFDIECADEKPCGKMLDCGIHKCCGNCHLVYDHSTIKCNAVVLSKCVKGHVYNRICHAKNVCATCEIQAKKAQEETRWKEKVLQKQSLQMAYRDCEIEAIKTEAKPKPFRNNDPIKTSVSAALPLRSTNMLNLSTTFSIAQKTCRPSNAPNKTLVQITQPLHSANTLNLSATSSIAQKACGPSNAPNKTLVHAAQPLRSANTLNLSATSSIGQKACRPSNAPNKTLVQTTQPLRIANMLNLNATSSIAQKACRPSNAPNKTLVQAAQPLRSATSSIGQKACRPSNAPNKTLVQAAQPLRSANTLNLSATSSIGQKVCRPVIQPQQLLRDVATQKDHKEIQQAQLRWLGLQQQKFETVQTQVPSQQQLREAAQAKAERARIRAMKHKRAQAVEEQRLNDLREAQLHMRKQEQQAQKKHRDLGTDNASFGRTKQSDSYWSPEEGYYMLDD